MAPSSAKESAPHKERRPPPAQSARIASGFGTRRAIAAGVRKIPEPIVMPTTTPIALQSPSFRGNDDVTSFFRLLIASDRAGTIARHGTRSAGAGTRTGT